MKSSTEIDSVYDLYGDDLYTAAVHASGSEKSALPLLIQANEALLDSGRHFKTDRQRCVWLCKKLSKLGGRPCSGQKRYQLPDADAGRITAAARMYANSGGKERSRIETYIAAGVIFLMLIIVAIIAMNFVASQEFDEQTKAYFDAQREQGNVPSAPEESAVYCFDELIFQSRGGATA